MVIVPKNVKTGNTTNKSKIKIK